jgi:hypothetical protein
MKIAAIDVIGNIKRDAAKDNAASGVLRVCIFFWVNNRQVFGSTRKVKGWRVD